MRWTDQEQARRVKRDRRVRELRRDKLTMQEIADIVGLTRARVSQILNEPKEAQR